MTKDQILERIKLLEASRDQLKANFAAHEGALQEANYWLQQQEEKKIEDE